MSELASVNSIQSVAASGTGNAVIQIPLGSKAQVAVINVAAEYAAVSATASGISATLSLSTDGGSTYTASNVPTVKVAPAAGVVGTGIVVLPLGSHPFRVDGKNFPDHIKVNLTNLDGTNAANVAITSQIFSHRP